MVNEANIFSFILNNVKTNYIKSDYNTHNAYQRISDLNLNFLYVSIA